MNLLELLFKNHKMWLNYIKSFGCSNDIAEDYVQEMYIKVFNYVEKNGNELMYNKDEVNYHFIYVVLKNMYYDDLRKSKRVQIEPITSDFIQDETEYNEKEFYLKTEAMQVWLNNLDKEIESINEYNRYKANLTYIRFIFQKVFIENIQISKLSRDVGITYWSLRNTVLIIKQQIKDEIQFK